MPPSASNEALPSKVSSSSTSPSWSSPATATGGRSFRQGPVPMMMALIRSASDMAPQLSSTHNLTL